jgi:preprotein translocase SecE subunit
MFQVISFFKASWIEFKKVHFPSRKDTIAITVRVLFLIFLFATLLGLIDFAIGNFVQWVLNTRG